MDIKSQIRENFLHLNEDKTECTVWGDAVMDGSGSLSPTASSAIRNLGVIFDSCLKFDMQISNVVKTSFYY